MTIIINLMLIIQQEKIQVKISILLSIIKMSCLKQLKIQKGFIILVKNFPQNLTLTLFQEIQFFLISLFRKINMLPKN